LGATGQKHLQVTPENTLKSMMWAWEKLAPYKRLIQWTWTSRGLVTAEEMREMNGGEAGEDPAEDVAATVFRAELIPGIPVLTPCPGKPNIFYLKMKSNTQTIH